MPCYHPLKAYRSKEILPSGKRAITFKRKEGYADMPVTLPCGQCVGCRLERSRQWAMRCYHEASLFEHNCFITLTFNSQHLPEDMSLDVRDWQLFMKKLRKKYGSGIRFFHCGEYGSHKGRPHYHACLFNFDFPDKKLWQIKNGYPLYRSPSLEELWPYGYSTIGEVTFESAAYVARYIMKKITGEAAEEHYQYVDPETGEIFDRKPEYTTMSRRPGIGKKWFEQFASDVYPSDFVVVNGKKLKPPKYYDGLFEVEDPDAFNKIKGERRKSAKQHIDNNTPERLIIRERVQLNKLARLERNHDNG